LHKRSVDQCCTHRVFPPQKTVNHSDVCYALAASVASPVVQLSADTIIATISFVAGSTLPPCLMALYCCQ